MRNFQEMLYKAKGKGLSKLEELNSGKYAETTGWLDLPFTIDDQLNKIKEVAFEVRNNSEVLVIIGIGGSYLGSRAVIEALTNKYDKDIEIIYLGTSLSSLDMKETLDYLKTKDFTVNVISKSGTTMEPALAFSFVKKILFEKYSKEEALNRIIVTTDKVKGELREFVNENKVKSFIIPDDVGGRYSVLTPVGLLPIAIAGVDIDRLISGARTASSLRHNIDIDNLAVEYAAIRNVFYEQGLEIEILVTYEPRLKYFAEWWKQLFGESEGKDGQGLFPASATFTTDLHSIGQLIQDGKRNLFETHLSFSEVEHDLIINPAKDDVGIKYLTGHTVNYVNEQAKEGTIQAHMSGGVPITKINMDVLDEDNIGQLIYFFQLSCAISGLILGVNPFDQPGVEAYKKNIKNLLS